MSVDSAELLAALDAYVDPLIGRGLVAAGCVHAASIDNGVAKLHLRLAFPAAGYRDVLATNVRQVVREGLGLDCELEIDWVIGSQAVQRNLRPMAQIRNIIAVASGKGGVGKSTVAANLALALQAEGARNVGLFGFSGLAQEGDEGFFVGQARDGAFRCLDHCALSNALRGERVKTCMS